MIPASTPAQATCHLGSAIGVPGQPRARPQTSHPANSTRQIPQVGTVLAVLVGFIQVDTVIQADAVFGQVVDDVDQMSQVPAEPVQLPDDQGVPVPQGFESGGQLGPVFLLAGGLVLIQGVRSRAGGQERVRFRSVD